MPILTVTQLNRYVASIIHEDPNLRTVFVRGEIANFTRNFRSGHCYFSVRDAEASVRAVMFRSNAERLQFEPSNGLHVLLIGSVTLYERDGAYQINVTDLQPDGVGAQALALQQRRERLAQLGYFDPARKRPLPKLPKKIGIVTSRSGAALQDMLQILSRRYPIGTVQLYPALVQGESAPQSIADALEQAGKDGCDVVLMGRGGGSNEDLLAFQSEEVAKAVFASPVPVVSAVGHETDHCIADEVADLRAPTPSAAAELAVPDMAALRASLQNAENDLRMAIASVFVKAEERLNALQSRLEKQSPVHRIALAREQCQSLNTRYHAAVQLDLSRRKQQLASAAARLEAVSPVAILQRGYALVYHGDTLLRSANEACIGDQIEIRLASGAVTAQITGKKEAQL